MKRFTLSLFAIASALVFATNAHADAPDASKPGASKAEILAFLKASPVVLGALKQIRLSKSRHLDCHPLQVDAITAYSFSASAYCNGSDGPAETEWSEVFNLEADIYDSKVFHISKLTFQTAG